MKLAEQVLDSMRKEIEIELKVEFIVWEGEFIRVQTKKIVYKLLVILKK